MTDERKPISGEYVFLPIADDADLTDNVEMEGVELRKIKELPGAFLGLRNAADVDDDQLFGHLRDMFGSKYRILRALEDDRGNRLIPTGQLAITFKRDLGPESLQYWLDLHGLALLSESKWLPNTVMTAPSSTRSDIDSIVDQVASDDLVETVDRDVLARFSRA